MEAALYHPERGFYAGGLRGAGRRGRDFLTSPEVGPLFGAVVARALDAWWEEAGRPASWTVVDSGAGPGTLGRAVALAGPACRPEWSDVEVGDALPARADVVLANELLDNLPFDVLEYRDGRWWEVLFGQPGQEALVPTDRTGPDGVVEGARIPVQEAAVAWLRHALGMAGRVVALDYCSTTAEMSARRWTEWVRTYRSHGRGSHPLADLGAQDITCEVAVDQLAAVRTPDHDRSQAEWLAAHGIDELVEEGKRVWRERAAIGDLAAVRARSRINEAAALTDPTGLGAFRVLEWIAPPFSGREMAL
jgi:SAM-dependent MidA family methyltransferase